MGYSGRKLSAVVIVLLSSCKHALPQRNKIKPREEKQQRSDVISEQFVFLILLLEAEAVATRPLSSTTFTSSG